MESFQMSKHPPQNHLGIQLSSHTASSQCRAEEQVNGCKNPSEHGLHGQDSSASMSCIMHDEEKRRERQENEAEAHLRCPMSGSAQGGSELDHDFCSTCRALAHHNLAWMHDEGKRRERQENEAEAHLRCPKRGSAQGGSELYHDFCSSCRALALVGFGHHLSHLSPIDRQPQLLCALQQETS